MYTTCGTRAELSMNSKYRAQYEPEAKSFDKLAKMLIFAKNA